MPILGAVLLVDVALIFHASKTGRCQPWCYIILMVPGFGALAYVVVELIPEWFGTYEGQKARARISRALNPEKAYRALRDNSRSPTPSPIARHWRRSVLPLAGSMRRENSTIRS
jgi:hypothetical protein